MNDWLREILLSLTNSPTMQGTLAALSTFILEDPTTIGCGLLVAEQKMAFLTALIGVSLGIAIGDVGLYGLGRLAGPRVRGWGPLTPQRLDRASQWFGRNLVTAVVFSRFVPGMRLPTYVLAGMLRARFWHFTAVAIAASLVWTLLLLTLTVKIGEAVLPLLGNYRWPVAALAVLALVGLQRKAAGTITDSQNQKPVLSRFELWPPWLFYIPVGIYWFWLSLRHRGLLLPTAANPTIFSGGFIGESKEAILDLVPEKHNDSIAQYTCIERGQGPTDAELGAAKAAMHEAGLTYPIVVKPDVGQRGDGVQPVQRDDELRSYLEHFPPAATVMLQEMVPRDTPAHDDPIEAGVLYWRRPGVECGEIFSITLKIFPEVIGDGLHNLRQLINNDPRAHRLSDVYLDRHKKDLDRILEMGERLPLVFAGNHCQGTIFKNGTDMVTASLAARIDSIASSIPGFYFGRFDIRFADFEDFLKGENFKIIEINGASAEATHIWDASITLTDAYRTLFTQFRTLFEIGKENRKRGHRPMGLIDFFREVLKYRRLSKR